MQSSVTASNNTWIGEEYSPFLIEKIIVMLKREEYSLCNDYLNAPVPPYILSSHFDVFDEQYRQKTAEWMYKVVDFYDLDRDLVNTAMTNLDRMMAVSMLHHQLSKNQCCLLSMACLKLAIKLLEPRTFHMVDMIKLGMSTGFTPKQIIGMEHEILWTLKWNVMPCTVIQFAHYIITMMPVEVPKSTRYLLQELSKYMSELAICVYKFVTFKPSVKAIAIVSCALDSLDVDIAVSPESYTVFALRVYDTFGLWSRDDEEINMLKVELKNLVCHNTDLAEFVKLIRASHKEAEGDASVSPKSAAVNVFAC